MGKIAASDYAKIAKYVSKYPNEFKKTPNNLLFRKFSTFFVSDDLQNFTVGHLLNLSTAFTVYSFRCSISQRNQILFQVPVRLMFFFGFIFRY